MRQEWRRGRSGAAVERATATRAKQNFNLGKGVSARAPSMGATQRRHKCAAGLGVEKACWGRVPSGEDAPGGSLSRRRIRPSPLAGREPNRALSDVEYDRQVQNQIFFYVEPKFYRIWKCAST